MSRKMSKTSKILRGGFVVATMVAVAALLAGCNQPTPEDEAANVRAHATLTVASGIAPRLHDPKSLQIVDAVREVNTGAVCIIYSAKNLFGARVKKGFASVGGRVADYGKVCTQGGSYENHTLYVKWKLR